MTKLILYGTEGCHLCDEAEIIVNRLLESSPTQFVLEQSDIALDEELMELYGVRIPVIKKSLSGKELGWPFDEHQLSDFLSEADDT